MSSLPSISKFFENRDVLVTGATGFVGKVLIEKLLRSCPGIHRIFIIIRNKRGVSFQDRIKKEFIDCELFEKLQSTNPDAVLKIVPISGDVTELGVGLSDADKKRLEDVSVVFHGAASVRFDDPLKQAILMNTRGTREMLELAMTLKKLVTFLHISTTFCNCDHREIEEKIYPAHLDWRKAIQMAETFDQTTLDILTKKVTDFMPNTYVFTKGLAENLCEDYKDRLPIVIFRPAIVTGIEHEPLPGWVANFNGPTGLMVGAGTGVLRIFLCDSTCPLYCTPADACCNAMIVAAWKKGTNEPQSQLSIYNCATGTTTVDELIGENMREYVNISPLTNTFWYPGGGVTKYKYYYAVMVILVHFLPALLADTILKAIGYQPILMRVQRKVHNAGQALQYFVTQTFVMRCQNYIDLVTHIKDEDRLDFKFPVEDEQVDRFNYLKHQILSGRRYLMKDPPETLPAAKRKIKILYFLHILLKYGLLTLILHWTYKYFLSSYVEIY